MLLGNGCVIVPLGSVACSPQSSHQHCISTRDRSLSSTRRGRLLMCLLIACSAWHGRVRDVALAGDGLLFTHPAHAHKQTNIVVIHHQRCGLHCALAIDHHTHHNQFQCHRLFTHAFTSPHATQHTHQRRNHPLRLTSPLRSPTMACRLRLSTTLTLAHHSTTTKAFQRRVGRLQSLITRASNPTSTRE